MTTGNARRALLLLGAGASLPAGYASTAQLTERVLSVQNPDGSVAKPPGLDGADADARVALVRSLLRQLYVLAERTITRRAVNYEDIAFLATQLHDELVGEQENPAIKSFVEEVRAHMQPRIERAGSEVCESLAELADYARAAIHHVVWQNLASKPQKTDHLAVLADAMCNGQIAGVATLAHDTHVDEYLAQSGLQLNDGFTTRDSDARYWAGDLPGAAGVPFLKLHGSVNWFRYRHRDDRPWNDRIAIPTRTDRSFQSLGDGAEALVTFDPPILLIGTFNKLMDYSSEMFVQLQCHFRQVLASVSRLVVCGYSFGDRRINDAIIEWRWAAEDRRVVVVHGDKVQLLHGARPAAARLLEGSSCVFLETWLESLTIQQLREGLMQ